MFRRFLSGCAIIALGVMLLGSLTAANAQTSGQPDAIINAVFKDLSQRLGKSLNQHNVDNWAWEQDIFPDASLGCPKPGQTYTQANTRGFKITITYLGTVYDYRVSDDGQTLILCSNGAPVGVSTPIPTIAASATPIPQQVNVQPVSYQNPMAYAGADGNVTIANLTTQPVTPLTSGAKKAQSGSSELQYVNFYSGLRWSPDGSKLLYIDRYARTVYVVVSGKAPVQVATGIAPDFPAAWSLDGNSVVYSVITQEVDANKNSIVQLQSVPVTGGQPSVAGQMSVLPGGCGGGGSDPAYALYAEETALNGDFTTFAVTDKGFLTSRDCTGVGIELIDPTGKAIWSSTTLGRVVVGADGKRALAAVLNNGDPQSLVILNLADGTTTPVTTQPGIDQFGWSPDENSIFYSTITDKQTIGLTASAQGTDAQVTLWEVPTAGGDSVKLFAQRGFGIGTITLTRDNHTVVFSFIPSIAKMIQAQSSGQSASQVQSLLPKTLLMSIVLDMDTGMVPKTLMAGRSVAFGSGTFTAISAAPSVANVTTGLTVGGHAVVILKAGDTLNLRQSPSTTAAVLRILKPGATVTILAGPQPTPDGLTWWQVRSDDDGAIGWAVDQVTNPDGTLEQTLAPQ